MISLSSPTRRSQSSDRRLRVLLLRGTAELGAAVGEMIRAGVRMVRIAVRPTWVGVLDFQTRLPEPVAR